MNHVNSEVAMIGVVARPDDHDVVREFFELFKTPWEFYRRDRRYRVVLQADGTSRDRSAELVLLYTSEATTFDHERKRLPGPPRRNTTLSWDGDSIPVYGHAVPFPADDHMRDLTLKDSAEPAAWVTRSADRTLVRVGYDLFREIRLLLTKGQPPAHAAIPTLERHIALLRSWILGAGIPVVEIPPVPEGHRFIVCLTHDLDHPSIRFHRFDRTTLGFLYRAVVGSVIKVFQGRMPLTALRRNVAAALTLPFVHLGWAEDFWYGFDRYLEIEKGLASTFFVIPVKGNPGRTLQGPAPRNRGSSYGVSDIADRVRSLAAAGSEVGVHGIDAWLDSGRGCEEREAVSRVAGTTAAGVRMHWLFFDEKAPARLEQAGFAYDSTFGYNETVGLRAGTLQAFRPLTAGRLLEIPLTIMDTALFYPSYLNLTEDAARRVVWPLVDSAQHYGGALTINWHDRSLAPERLWGSFYSRFVDELRRLAPWFPTVAQAASWFHQRRSVVFDSVRWDGDSVHVKAFADCQDDLPGLSVRVYMPGRRANGNGANGDSTSACDRRASFTDVAFRNTVDAHIRVQPLTVNNLVGHHGIRSTQEMETR
jgi:hypothetical protein